MGFAAAPLQLYSGAYPLGLINSSGQPWAINVYQMPVEQAGGGFLATWPALLATLTPQYLSPTGTPVDPATGQPSGLANGPTAFANDLGVEGYPLYLLGGVAMLDDAAAPGAAASLELDEGQCRERRRPRPLRRAQMGHRAAHRHQPIAAAAHRHPARLNHTPTPRAPVPNAPADPHPGYGPLAVAAWWAATPPARRAAPQVVCGIAMRGGIAIGRPARYGRSELPGRRRPGRHAGGEDGSPVSRGRAVW